jgi:hypothetical protein
MSIVKRIKIVSFKNEIEKQVIQAGLAEDRRLPGTITKARSRSILGGHLDRSLMDHVCNAGGMEKNMRLVVGFASAADTLFGERDATKKVVAGVVSAIALTTAFSGFCPLNSLPGINTCEEDAPRTYS